MALPDTKAENATEKTREAAPLLVKQIWDFLEEQLEVAEKREMTVGRFVTAANEVTIGGFWREHARGELRTRRDHEILGFLSPCWKKEFLARVYSAKETIFGAFIQEILNMPISLMQNRHLTGEEESPKTRDEWRKVNGGMPLLTDLCLAMRSDPMGMIRGWRRS